MFGFYKNRKNTQSLEQSEFETENESSLIQGVFPLMRRFMIHILYFSLIIGFAFYVKHETNLIKQSSQISIAREADILTALNDLDVKVERLADDHQQISTLKTELSHIEQTMVTENSLSDLAKASDMKKISIELQKLAHPSASLHTRHASSRISKTPSSTNADLPFQVLSVDSMAGQAFASVKYHQDTLPLRLNDQLVGWKAVKLDSLKGVVVWENKQHRRITTTVAEISHA